MTEIIQFYDSKFTINSNSLFKIQNVEKRFNELNPVCVHDCWYELNGPPLPYFEIEITVKGFTNSVIIMDVIKQINEEGLLK